MTTMTLRISGKNPRNNSKLHGDHKKIHITVNARFLNEARTLETNCYCVSDEVEKLSKVETVEEQLKILKLMAKNCSMSDCDSENKLLHFCVKLLTDFYLTATPKNPLKNAIPRLLSTFPQAAHDDITAYLSYELTKLMESTLQNSSPLKEMNAVVNTISCCFVNNFTLGIKSVGHAIVDVIAYIKSCLSRYIKELKQNIPIAAKQEVCQFSHATMQTLVSVLQKCQPSIKSRMSARDDPGQEPAPANGIVENGVGEDVAAMLAELRKSAEELLNLDDCPMDMKANCGLVVVLLSMYLEGDEGWQKLLSRGAAPSDGVQLCLCVGVLNALSPRQLLSAVPPSGRPVLWSVFDQLVGVSCRASASSSMALAASRAMLLLSRDVLACVQGGGGAPVLPLERLREALVFVWTHLEHYMDSVRHSAHVTLLNYVRAAAALANPGGDDGKAMNAIMESVMNIPAFKKCRYVGLSTLAREIGCQPILERVPSLVEDFISSLDDTAVSASVSGAFETLMLRHEGECADPDAWVSTWLLPALRRMAAPALDGVLSKAVGRRPAVVLRLLGADPGRLRAVLTCLRAGRRRGALSADDGWKGLLPCSLLEGALWHRDEQIRVCALSLLVESHRSTEALSGSDLQLVRTFLEYNINTQSPATRQQALALVKKLLIRVKDSSAVLARATEQAGKGDPPAAASAEPCPTAQLRTYNTFLLWLVDFCLASLFPGANFGHRGSALQILVYIQELVGFEPSDPVWRHSPPDMWTSSNADTLLECLKDTYENNKSLALSLLVRFPAEALGLNDEDYAGLLLDAGCQMASSNRPPDCVTAAYLLKLLSSFPVPVATLAARVGEAPRGGALFYVVCRLEAQLSGELEVARRSISLAAAKGPMYGTLCCVRYLLKDTDLRELCGDTAWRELISRLITLCFQLNGVVSCVVNSSSPEGSLPMDFLPVVKDDNVELPVQNVTAQMLLLCSWRTVKEVSLFLGELSERAPIITEGSPESGLMTEEQVLAIGEHFTALLSETKHRGAFEQAYVGFCQLCSRLWGHPAGRLHRLPAAWLAELMALIAEGGGGVLCATRRSAGVPFMVQALVTTQLQAGGGPGCFQQSMSALLSLAGRAAGGAEARAHAFNILRALFRYSALGELVTPYVAEGVMVAVRGFRGSTWAERNAATLLFGALITRIFGVPRSKDEKLRMTGRVFFHRYPQLFDFLLEELQNITATMAQDSIDAPQLYPSLYPVLVLLSRLYPSSLEGSDSKLQLKVYVPHVMACGHSCMVHTRILAARALVPLVTPNVFVTYVSQMFREVSATQGVLQNRRHGLLLQIVHLLQGASHTGTVGDEVRLMVDAWVAKSEWLLLARAGISLVTQETYLRVLTLLGADYFSSIQAATWLKFYEHLERVVFGNTALCGMIGKPVFEKTATSLLLQIAVSMDTEPRDISQRLGKILVRLLEHPEVEVVMSALRFVLGIFDNVDEAGGEDEDLGLVQVRSWNPSNKLQLMDEIRLHAELLQAVADLALRDSMYPPCRRLVFRLLYHCREAFLMARWHDVDKSDLLLRLCSEEHENVSYTVLLSLGAFMLVHQEHKRELPISSEQASKMCQILLEFSSPEKPQLCRHSAAKVLLQNSYLLSETVPFLSDVDVLTLWTAVLALLQDDAEAVRDAAADLAGAVPPSPVPPAPVVPHKARELLVDWFVTATCARDPVACSVALLAWSLAGAAGDDPADQPEERVFDKGEMNTFAEEVTVTDLCCQHLSRVVERCGVETPVAPRLVRWFRSTGLGEDGVGYEEEGAGAPACLGGLVRLAQGRLLAAEPRGDRTFHFLVPGQKAVFLSVFKVRRVVEAMLAALA